MKNYRFYFGTIIRVVIPVIIMLIGLLCVMSALYSIHWFLASITSLAVIPIFCVILYKWLSWIIKRWL